MQEVGCLHVEGAAQQAEEAVPIIHCRSCAGAFHNVALWAKEVDARLHHGQLPRHLGEPPSRWHPLSSFFVVKRLLKRQNFHVGVAGQRFRHAQCERLADILMREGEVGVASLIADPVVP